MHGYAIIAILIIGTLIGYLSEKMAITRNGYLVSIIIAVGGAMVLFFGGRIFGFAIGSRTFTAVVGAVGALFLSSMRR